MRKLTGWTAQELTMLRVLWPDAPLDEVIAAFPRHSPNAIRRRAQVLSVRRSVHNWSRKLKASPLYFMPLRQRRLDLGMTVPDLAAILGCHPQMIWKYESGNAHPLFGTFLKWLDALRLEISYRPKSSADTRLATALPSAEIARPSRGSLMAGRA